MQQPGHRPEPLTGHSITKNQGHPQTSSDDDTLLSDILAFVDTFPADSDQLLTESGNACGGRFEVVDDTENLQPPALPVQSREERRREANRLKDRNKYLRKKVSKRLPPPHSLQLVLSSALTLCVG